MPSAALASGPVPGEAKATLLRETTLMLMQDMDFGTIVPSTTSTSTIRVAPDDVVTVTGGAMAVGGGQYASRLSGTATPNQVVHIPPPAISWLMGPGPAIRLRSWRIGEFVGIRRVLGTSSDYLVTAPTGAFSFRYGATIDIAPNQPDGDYVGTFTIQLDYL